MLHMNMFHVKILADSHFLGDTENIFLNQVPNSVGYIAQA